MSESFSITDADLVTVGAVGEPGRRLFFLQVRAATTVVSVKVEKQHVAALVNAVVELMQNLPRPGELPADIEPDPPDEMAWRVGDMQLGYDEALDRLVLTANELVLTDSDGGDGGETLEGGELEEDVDDADEPTGATLRILATREQMAAIAIRGTQLVEGGRPPCPLCGHPLDPAGHVCPRTNGHRPPRL